MSLTVIILTKDEERHIARALRSVVNIAHRCIVVDSGSTDRTVEIAVALGAEVIQNRWVNHASQFNWAIRQLRPDTEWILRLDADEIVTDDLATEISERLSGLPAQINGICIFREIKFLGRAIRWGGDFPIRVIRIFRYGYGCCEQRWMDEHIVVQGGVENFRSKIIDDNLNSLTWWTEKHNRYSSLEAIELLDLRYKFMRSSGGDGYQVGREAGIKRWIKETLYAKLPLSARALMYLIYRLIFRLGFLDGRTGMAFHFLQGFWYRYLVDMKILEVERCMEANGVNVVVAIKTVMNVDIEG